jgi:hypothetical protein
MKAFDFSTAPMAPRGARWFIMCNGRHTFGPGFKIKEDARNWLDEMRVDRCGWIAWPSSGVELKIVDKNGKSPK